MDLQKFVWDTSALISMFRTHDPYHLSCYQFMMENKHHIHIFPVLSWFEVQATLSRLEREGQKVLRDMYIIDEKNYISYMDSKFIELISTQKLEIKFSNLRGADLVFACTAILEGATLVTRDKAFLSCEDLNVIIPSHPDDPNGFFKTYSS